MTYETILVETRGRVGLAEGLGFERPVLYATFATAGRTKGTRAFAAERPPAFSHR